MKRKGQAAMEFLMTYGWAILAAIIVIGVLAFYFRPSSISEGQTRANSPFFVEASNALSGTANNGGVTLELRWDGSSAIGLNLINVTDTGFGECSNATTGASGTFSPGQSNTIFVPCTSAVTAGATIQGDMVISYNQSGSTVVQRSTGVVSETAQ